MRLYLLVVIHVVCLLTKKQKSVKVIFPLVINCKKKIQAYLYLFLKLVGFFQLIAKIHFSLKVS